MINIKVETKANTKAKVKSNTLKMVMAVMTKRKIEVMIKTTTINTPLHFIILLVQEMDPTSQSPRKWQLTPNPRDY
jgi:hypothetical protein